MCSSQKDGAPLGAGSPAEMALRQQRAQSIAAIPGQYLPWPRVRAALIYRALAGFEVYAYEAPYGLAWYIFDRDAKAPGGQSRFTPEEWMTHAQAAGWLDDTGNGGQL